MRSTLIDQSSASRADIASPSASSTVCRIESRILPQGRPGKIRFSTVALALAMGAFAIPQSAEANLKRAELRKLGYEGRYVGVVSGRVSSRPGFTGAFSDTLVRRTHRELVPPKRIVKAKSPDGSGGGAYRIANRVRVNQRRAIIEGRYFGIAYNPVLDAHLVRTGTKRLEIRRAGLLRFRYGAQLTDNMVERNRAGGAVIKQWSLRGSLR